VLRTHPDHAGACHYYIHAVEASPTPERALAASERLGLLVPGAGHLVHMPSHIYARVARYDDALHSNERAVALDEEYLTAQKPAGVYGLMYYNHNIHFIWFASIMQGRSAKALAAARKIAGNLTPEIVAMVPMIEHVPAIGAATLARFGRWEEVLREPQPPRAQRYATGSWHWARGLAYAGLGQLGPARTALDSLQAAHASLPPDLMIVLNNGKQLLRIASGSLAGAIATREKRWDDAVRHLQAAIATEDSLHYDEPPTWYFPVRHQLGATFLAAGRAAEAEAAYRADLARHPGNGWSLFGMSQALRVQNKTAEATEFETRFRKEWARADVTLTASAY
jgi:tetratricopeptide (TPR) repeat protein